MGLVLACAQQHDGGDPRRESSHGARSLDWVRPIAPVAHRTERSAPDRKAAGSIPARRTSKPDETPPNGFSRVSCPAVFLQHPLDQAIEPLGLEVDVGGQHTYAFVVRTVRFFYLLAQSLDPGQRRLELTVQRGARCLNVGQHLEELPALEDHVQRQEYGKGRGARRHEEVDGMPRYG